MSNCQEMGETREPMAYDCVQDALKIANLYEHVGKDFWICFASKPHRTRKYAAVNGWEVVWQRPKEAVVGMLVWYVDSRKKEMNIVPELSLPYDIPLIESELSTDPRDVVPSVAIAGRDSGSVLVCRDLII